MGSNVSTEPRSNDVSSKSPAKDDRTNNKLLKNLQVLDNIHSPVIQQIMEDPDSHRTKRRCTPVNYEGNAQRNEKLRSSRSYQPLFSRALPPEFNSLNKNIQLVSHDIRRKPYLIQIKYDPLKLLNFERLLLHHSAAMPVDQHDFPIYEAMDLLSIMDNESSVPYRGVYSHKKDYSTVKTVPSVQDRQFFQSLLNESASAKYFNSNVSLTYHDNGKGSQHSTRRVRPNRKIKTRSIEYIYLRDCEIKTWYTTPFPEKYNRNKILHMCEYCLKYTSSRFCFARHQYKCTKYRPPGTEIYRDGKLSVWEVDGRENVIYCQNLCLLAKLFLNSKTLYYDVEPFIFYILTEREDVPNESPRFHLVGYFSQEKLNSTDYNLSCILTLPIYQRKGYGHFLMEFSYLLSRRLFKWGTPEKPLSDLGLLSYRNFWKIKCAQTLVQLKSLFNEKGLSNLVLEDISNLTGMTPTDVVFGLEQLKIFYRRRKESDNTFEYAIKIDSWDYIEEIWRSWLNKGYQQVNPKKLVWKPMIFGPSCGVNAVGTMVETSTGNTRNIASTGDASGPAPQQDFFKKSISVLVNFMKDDISDPRDMEVIAMEKLKREYDDKTVDDISNKDLAEGWELCHVEPTLLSNGTVHTPTISRASTIVSESAEVGGSLATPENDTPTVGEEDDEDEAVGIHYKSHRNRSKLLLAD